MVSFSKRIQRQNQNQILKRQIQQGLFEYNIYGQKIKNPAKISRPTTIHALGSKGRCPSGFEKKSPHFRKLQVVFFSKTLTAQSVRLKRWLYFSFFSSSFFSFSFLGVKIIYGRSSCF
jgi:hypothetical protein